MTLLVWIGLAVSMAGLLLLTIFGLVWVKDTFVHTWGFRVGIALMLAGVSLLSVAN